MKQVRFSACVFETPLIIRREIEAVMRDGARVEAILVEDYRVSFALDGARWSLTVPTGFEAAPSVPTIFHGVVPVLGALYEASFVHDYCYETGCFDPMGSGRKHADRLLHALMIAGGASRHDTDEVYAAVRIFGGDHYGPPRGPKTGRSTLVRL